MSSSSESKYNLLIKLLQQCPLNRLQKLFHHLIDVFCGQQNNFYVNYSDIYAMLEWWDLNDQIKLFLKEIYSQDNNEPLNLDLLPNEYKESIKDVLDVRSSDLKDILIEKSHTVSPAYLKSFDWKVKLTLASDKMSQLNEARLLLDLETSGTKDKLLQLELGKDELKSLIDTMEKIKTQVIDMKIADN